MGPRADSSRPPVSAFRGALQQIAQLPLVDEHAVTIVVGVEQVWPVLVDTLDRSFGRAGAARYARVVGCDPDRSSGPRPLAKGSTVPGFRVVAVVPGSELWLRGRHRFSYYALIFRLEPLGSGGSRLRAESRAGFPGLTGGLYRLLVVRTGGHVIAVRRLLSAIRDRSEAR
jgi:hypothetical protein